MAVHARRSAVATGQQLPPDTQQDDRRTWEATLSHAAAAVCSSPRAKQWTAKYGRQLRKEKLKRNDIKAQYLADLQLAADEPQGETGDVVLNAKIKAAMESLDKRKKTPKPKAKAKAKAQPAKRRRRASSSSSSSSSSGSSSSGGETGGLVSDVLGRAMGMRRSDPAA